MRKPVAGPAKALPHFQSGFPRSNAWMHRGHIGGKPRHFLRANPSAHGHSHVLDGTELQNKPQ